MSTIDLTDGSFESTVEGNDIVFVDWWASWCGPCRMFAPIYDEVAAESPDVVFAKVDTEANPALSTAFEIRSIPTLMVFRDQILVFSHSGVLPKEALVDVLGQVRALDMDEVRRSIDERAVAG